MEKLQLKWKFVKHFMRLKQWGMCYFTFWLCFGSMFFLIFSRIEIRKIGEVFWTKLYFKMSDLFAWYLLALRYSATNSAIKKTLMKKKVVRPFGGHCFRVLASVFFYFSSLVNHGNRYFHSTSYFTQPTLLQHRCS